MPIEPGQSLSHYRLVEKIGEGGMGVVWKALDTKLNRHVALKVLPPELTMDPDRRLRFQREAQAAAALDHPNIAVIHEVGESEGNLFLAMQFLEGETLRQVIEQRALTPSEWVRLALPIAEGLAHAHQHGVVHRDLKPDNVMITTERQVKILDFGLAKLLRPDAKAHEAARDLQSSMETISHELTRVGKVFGTVVYMSPEQARGEPLDHRSDLFSFGIVLYQMASGRLPFKGNSDIETLHSIITEEPPPLSVVKQEIPMEAERVVRKAMEKEPRRRYQHADELATDLRNLKRDLDSGRVSIATGVAPRRGISRKRHWGILGAAALAAILLAGGFHLYRNWRMTSGPAASLMEDHSLGVLGFENLSDSRDSENLGRMLMALITTDLVETGGLNVLSTARVMGAINKVGGDEGVAFRTFMVDEVARLAGADLVLVGQVDQVGEGLLLTAELVDMDSGTALGSFTKKAGSRSELFELAGGIATEVRDSLGLAGQAASSRGFGLARALTSSPEAYRSYVMGELEFHQLRFPQAIDHFRRAIEEDPTFAMAHYRLALTYAWNGNHPESVEAIEEGLRNISRLPERWRIMYQAMRDWITGGYETAYEAVNQLVTTTTDLPDAHYLQGEIATHSPRYLDARKAREAFEKALEIDPTFTVVAPHLMEDYIKGDDLNAAESLVVRLRRERPDHLEALEVEAYLLMAEGRYDEAVERGEELMARRKGSYDPLFDSHLLTGNYDRPYTLADEAVRTHEGYPRAWALRRRGGAQFGRGRLRESLSDLEAAVEPFLAGELLNRITPIDGCLFQLERARLLEMIGEVDAAVEAAAKAIQIDDLYLESYFWLGKILLGAERVREAEQTHQRLQDAARRVVAPGGEFWVHLLQAELDLAGGNVAAAAAAVERASRLAPEYRNEGVELLTQARVREASGDLAGALASCRAAFGPRVRLLRVLSEGLVQEVRATSTLARLEEKTGDLVGARQHYQELLDRWGKADPPIPEVKVARARLAALESP